MTTDIDIDTDTRTESADWAPSRWRRWMRVVFAPWAAAAMDGVGERGRGRGRGVEFEIWAGGVRAVGEGEG